VGGVVRVIGVIGVVVVVLDGSSRRRGGRD